MPMVIQAGVPVRGLRVGTRAVRRGALASVGLAVFYVVVVALASGSGGHLVDQMRQDWLYLVVITTGFGVQVALLSELRHRRALQPELAAVGGAGATASGVGMVAITQLELDGDEWWFCSTACRDAFEPGSP